VNGVIPELSVLAVILSQKDAAEAAYIGARLLDLLSIALEG